MFKIKKYYIFKYLKFYFTVLFRHIFLYKKREGYFKYAIITFAHNSNNIERYMESVISQRLDFEKNIFLIFIGNSNFAKNTKSIGLINIYKNKYPNNIIYIENNNNEICINSDNLKNIIENCSNVSWVSFIDLNNFLDINYFYCIDNILNRNTNAKLLVSNCIYNGKYIYYDKTKFYVSKDEFYRLNIDFCLDIFVFNADIIKTNIHSNITPLYKLSEAYFLENYLNIIKSDILLINAFVNVDIHYNNFFDFYFYDKFNHNIEKILHYLYSNYIVIPDFIQKAMLYDVNIFIYCIEKKIISPKFCVVKFLDEYFSFISNIDLVKQFDHFIKGYYKEIIIYFKQVRNNFKHIKHKINKDGLLCVYYYTFNLNDVEEFFVNKNELFPMKEDTEELIFLENIKIYKKIFILNVKKLYFYLCVNINGENVLYHKVYNFKNIFYNNRLNINNVGINDIKHKAIKAQNKLLLDLAIKRWRIIIKKNDLSDENISNYIRCLRLTYRYDEIEFFIKTIIHNNKTRYSSDCILELIRYAIESRKINLVKFLLKKHNNILFLGEKIRLDNILVNEHEIYKILSSMKDLSK